MIDVDAYLGRIGFSGSREPTAETLRDLQRAHLFAVPFENLDVIAAVPIVLDGDRMFDKIVTRRRGGFCYELNGCFAGLLRALGFDVTTLSARPLRPNGELAPEFAHMTLLVELQDRWLADVGFGDSFLEPLRLDDPGEQVSGGRAYRLSDDGDAWRMEHLFEVSDGLAEGYGFTLEPRAPSDFVRQCRAFESLPDSPFRRGRICSRATPSGRVSLSDARLIVTEDGERRERPIQGEVEFAAVLREQFGIEMPAVSDRARAR